MSKRIIKIGLSILLASLMILTIALMNKNDNNSASNGGAITVVINNINDEIVDVKRIEYKTGDTLYKLIEDNYNITVKNSSGHIILSIDGINTDFVNSWLWIELGYLKDGINYSDTIDTSDYDINSSTKGIDNIELVDNMIIAFNERNNTTNTSIIDRGIIKNNDNITSNVVQSKINYVKIIGLILLSMIILTFIVTFVVLIKKDKSVLTVKKLCILSCMTVILFASEEILTFLPNIQITFLLIGVYTCVFGFKNTTIIILIHVLLDNMIMGSMSPIVIFPMLIGYIMFSILMHLCKNKSIYIKAIISAIGGLIYSLLFLIANALFLEINIYHYFIMDIPFEVLLILCNVLTIIWLYNPIYIKINELYNERI